MREAQQQIKRDHLEDSMSGTIQMGLLMYSHKTMTKHYQVTYDSGERGGIFTIHTHEGKLNLFASMGIALP